MNYLYTNRRSVGIFGGLLLLILFSCCGIGRAAAQQQGAEQRITLSMRDTAISDILENITKRYQYAFITRTANVDTNARVSIDVVDEPLRAVLDRIFAGQKVAFEFDAAHLEEGAALVAFERCLDAKGNVVAVHEDVDDEGQTVVVDNPDTPEVPDAPGEKLDKTGVDLMPYMLGAGMALAAALALAAYGLQRRNPDDPDPDDLGRGEEAAEREA